MRHLIEALRAHAGQKVVVLVDEYDKPIVDYLAEPEVALKMREALRNLYGVLKDADSHLRFVFLTGVSKFSKVSLFSGLNQLEDLTLDARWSALCGYTQQDLETLFAPELKGVDLAAVRRWYKGYNWGGEAVYNPYDIMLYLDQRVFRSYWFETGTPAFLIEVLGQEGVFAPDLSRLETSTELLSRFDVGNIGREALLWQTGYLTLRETEVLESGESVYTLGYPNLEVEVALNRTLLLALGVRSEILGSMLTRVPRLLKAGDLPGFRDHLHALFASIPLDWHRRNPIARYEGYDASVFYSHLLSLGQDVRLEDATSKGRINMVVKMPGRIFIFEFKVVEGEAEGKALAQIQARGYADKFRQPGTVVTLVGIEFSQAERNVVGFEVMEG